MDRISSYMLNDFLKFERKIYNVLGFNLGRPLSLRTLLWFIGITGLVFGVSALPIIGNLFNWIPFLTRLFLCGALTYLITDVGTENRSPLRFLQSFIMFHVEQLKQQSFFRGKVLQKQKAIRFERLPSYGQKAKRQKKQPTAYQFTGFTIR